MEKPKQPNKQPCSNSKETIKQPCKYGAHCYRRNPSHLIEFTHPPKPKPSTKRKNDKSPDSSSKPAKSGKLQSETSNTTEKPNIFKEFRASYSKTTVPSLTPTKSTVPEAATSFKQADRSLTIPLIGSKEDTGPPPTSNTGGFHLTKIIGLPEPHNANCFTLSEILALDQESFEISLQLNFMVDLRWLMRQYPQRNRSKPLLIVTGQKMGTDSRSLSADVARSDYKSTITVAGARLDIPFGTHHTKMMILKYRSGIRVAIHTCNLIEQDWAQKTQAIYLTPLCPIGDGEEPAPDSSTNFRTDLIDYLQMYKLNALNPWVEIMRSCDFSAIKVYLVASVPGRHQGSSLISFGHLRLRDVLKKNLEEPQQKTTVLGQFSSIGSLGHSPTDWLTGEFLTSLSGSKSASVAAKPPLRLVYPTVDNVRNSAEGFMAGASLPYSIKTASKQEWLRNFLHQWASQGKLRSRASPHVKSYARVLQEDRTLSWFLITSANLSKAAWGALQKDRTQLMVRSYELGVLLLPESGEKLEAKDYLPFDYPLRPYRPNDKPWIMDLPYKDLPDTLGNMWDGGIPLENAFKT